MNKNINIKRFLIAITICIITIITNVGCSFNSVETDTSSKVDDNNQETVIDNEANKELEIDDVNIKDKNESRSNDYENDLDTEDEIAKDINSEKEAISLETEAQKEINLFLSNFTEVFLPDFQQDPSDEILINFGVRHNDINNFDAIEVKEHFGFLNKSIVERSIDRFFNLDVQHQKTDIYDFDGTNYIIQLASGAPANMAVVQEMYDNGDGNYTVYFDEVFSHELLDYSLTPKELEQEINNNPERTQVVSSKKAIVTRHNFEGRSIYKLLKYTTINN